MASDKFDELVAEAKDDINEIRPEKPYQKLDSDDSVHVIDIRENDEREEAAIPDSIHLNRGILERDVDEVVRDQSREVIVYCGGGRRSALAAKNLQKMGYDHVYSLKGGFKAWKDQELPVN